jgi:hypothetical protein
VAFDWHKGPVTRNTKIDETYRSTHSVRQFLTLECGEAFKFDRAFMAWIRSGAPKNMGDVADEWIRLHKADVER